MRRKNYYKKFKQCWRNYSRTSRRKLHWSSNKEEWCRRQV